jgi:hypothetical protein
VRSRTLSDKKSCDGKLKMSQATCSAMGKRACRRDPGCAWRFKTTVTRSCVEK